VRRLFLLGALRDCQSAAGFGCRATSRRGRPAAPGALARSGTGAFLAEVKDGAASFDLLRHPLLPYQREGMLHLAFGERTLLADEMGPARPSRIVRLRVFGPPQGHRARAGGVPGLAQAEWEEQIGAFTDRPARSVFGARPARLLAYASPHSHHRNYEQVLGDAADITRYCIRRGRARRGAAHQELADQDARRVKSLPLALCLRADPARRSRTASTNSIRSAVPDRNWLDHCSGSTRLLRARRRGRPATTRPR